MLFPSGRYLKAARAFAGLSQRLALVGEEQRDIAGLHLRLSQRQPQAHAVDGVAVLAALQGVSRPAPAEPLFCAAPWTDAIWRW